MAFHLLTEKGYDLFEVSSALQKDIRRANEKNALFWAYELELSNFGAYLWKRLVVISIEDIGPANPDAVAHVLAFKQAYEELKKKKSRETKLAVAAAVLYLARSDKSRLYDWAKCHMAETHTGQRPEIPDYALDKHTSRGRRLGKTIRDFFDDGCRVHPHRPAPLEDEYMAEAHGFYCIDTDQPPTQIAPGGDTSTTEPQEDFFEV